MKIIEAENRSTWSQSVQPRAFRIAGWFKTAFLAIVVGQAIFAHGCHGDDVDDELFALLRQIPTLSP